MLKFNKIKEKTYRFNRSFTRDFS